MFKALVAKYGPEPTSQNAPPPPPLPPRATPVDNNYRARLVAFFERYNPDKLPSVDATL